MSESILNIAGNQIVLPDEDAVMLYSILKDKAFFFSEYSGDINRVLEPLTALNVLTLTPAPLQLHENVAAAKAIGASYHEFMRKQP